MIRFVGLLSIPIKHAICIVFFAPLFYACSLSDPQIEVQVVFPTNSTVFEKNESPDIEIKLKQSIDIKHDVAVYINDSLYALQSEYPYQIILNCHEFSAGLYTLKVVVNGMKRNTVYTNFSIVELETVNTPVMNLDADSTYLYKKACIIENFQNEPGLNFAEPNGCIIFKRNYLQKGTLHFELMNGGSTMSLFINGKLVSGYFPTNTWTSYYFPVNQGLNVFRIQAENAKVSLSQISFSEGIQKHSIGEYFKGGVVFHLDSTLEHGTLAYPHEIATCEWGCMELYVPKDSSGITNHDGWKNTQWIAANCAEPDIAAKKCIDFKWSENDQVLNDWYLPTVIELRAIYGLKDYIANYKSEAYWTSFAYNTEISGILLFTDGSTHGTYRTSKNGVIPVHRF